MDDQTRKGSSPSRGSPLMKTNTAKGLLQIIVGSWKVRDLITKKEMRGVTVRDFEEMGKPSLPGNAQCACMLLNMMDNDPETELPLFNRKVFCLIKHLDKLMHPSINTGEGFPIGSSRVKGVV
jgi:hypothetical protein